MQFTNSRIMKLMLLLTFFMLTPVALVSQSNTSKPLRIPNPPSASDSVENPKGLITWNYHLQNRSSKELEPLLKEYVLNKLKGSKYKVYTEQNSIIFTISKTHLPILEKLLAKLDSPRSQVLIEVKVISLTYSKESQTGISLKHDMVQKATKNTTFYRGFELSYHPDDYLRALAANPTNPTTVQNNFLGMTLFADTQGESLARIGGLEAAVRMLAKTEKVQLVARPMILVEAGYTAKIETGQEVPLSYIQYWGTSSIVDTKFINVGIKLEMTPRNIGTDFVNLLVKPEISAVSSFYETGSLGISNPRIIKRNAETTITLKSGETLEIGGLTSDRTLVTSQGIPLLSDIPLIGYLFRSNNIEVRRQDIVFFITPTIVKPGEIINPDQFSMSDSFKGSK